MSTSIGYASEKIILKDYINSFAWEKRIVLFISKSKYVYFINETDNFFKENNCENNNRNLKYIRIVGDEIKKYIISEKFKNISYQKFLSKNLRVMDSAAITVARDNNIPIKVFSILQKNSFTTVYNNKLSYSEIS